MSYKDKKKKWENDDYYGTGAQFFPAMYTMLENLEEASAENEDDDYEDEYEDE